MVIPLKIYSSKKRQYSDSYMQIRCTSLYEKDILQLLGAHENLTKLSERIDVIRRTPNIRDLPGGYQAHAYSYSWNGHSYGVCNTIHIKGNLVLIYRIVDNVVECVRIGTHQDLKIGSSTHVNTSLIYI